MMRYNNKRYWRPLGMVAMLIGVAVLTYVLFVSILDRDEPLLVVFVILVGIPAIAPAALGYYMFKGRTWSAWTLRASIAGTLFLGFVLDVFGGLDVFSFAPLSIPLISGCVIWLVLSFY